MDGMYNRKKQGSTGFRFFIFLLLMTVTGLLTRMISGQIYGKKEFQKILSLGEMEYGTELLEKAVKIKGIRSVTPVLEVPVKLKIGDYTMDTTLWGVDLKELQIKVKAAKDSPLGNVPLLILGADSLGTLVDHNGHFISESEQKRLLQMYDTLQVFYAMGNDSGAQNGEPDWKECMIAGILKKPRDGMYLTYDQAKRLLGKDDIHHVLLTVQGKTNYSKALGYFQQ